MAGTAQQKKPVLDEAVRPADTLQAAQRAQAAQPDAAQAPSAYAQAKEKLGALGTFGSYANRMQALIQSKLAGVAAAAPQLQVAEAGLAQYADRPEVKAAVKGALETYLTDRSEANLIAVAKAMGGDEVANLQSLKSGGLTAMLQGSAETLSAFGQGLAPVTVADLAGTAGFEAWNLDELSGLLNVPKAELEKYSPDQLQASITQAVEREGGATAALQAELQSASPQRAQQIRDELRLLGVSGLGLAESEARAMAESLDSQEEVKFGGQTWNIQDLLKDDEISDQIKAAVSDPGTLAKLKETEPALAAWIEKHVGALKEVTGQIDVQTTALAQSQADWAKQLTDIPDSVRKALGLPEGILSAEQLATAQAQLAGSPLVTALTGPKGDSVRKAIETNPGLADSLLALPADTITKLIEDNDKLGALSDAEREILKGLGLEVTGDFIADPAKAASVLALRDAIAKPGAAEALAAMRSTLSPELLTTLGQNPALLSRALAVAGLTTANDAHLNKLLGFKAGGFPKAATAEELEQRVLQAERISKAYQNAHTLHTNDSFLALIKNGVLDTAAELELFVDADGFPKEGLAEQLHQSWVESELVKAAADFAKEGKGLHAMDRVAQLIVGKGATARHLAQMVDQSQLVLKHPERYAPDLVQQMKQLQAQMQVLDLNGDGVIRRSDIDPDFMSFDPKQDKPYTSRAEKFSALVAKSMGAMSSKFATDASDLTAVVGKPSFKALYHSIFPNMNPDEWLKDDPLSIVATKQAKQKEEADARKQAETEANQERARKRTTPTEIKEVRVGERIAMVTSPGSRFPHQNRWGQYETRQYYEDGHSEVIKTYEKDEGRAIVTGDKSGPFENDR
jgi:hypothetical protein